MVYSQIDLFIKKKENNVNNKGQNDNKVNETEITPSASSINVAENLEKRGNITYDLGGDGNWIMIKI